ncbi:hypothetical protein ACA910_014093 [Epithemia clementina (nom. ined.)]
MGDSSTGFLGSGEGDTGNNDDGVFVDTSGVYFQRQFDPILSMERYQSNIPRNGHSNNLTGLFHEDVKASEVQDYVLGLIFVGTLIIVFFLVWCVLLVLFMCIGRRIGFLSGARFVRRNDHASNRRDSLAEDHHDGDYNDDQEVRLDDEYGVSSSNKQQRVRIPEQVASPKHHYGDGWRSRATISRMVFIGCGVVCITFGLLLVTMGVTNLQTVINTVDKRSYDMNKIAESTIVLINRGMRDLSKSAQTLRGIIIEDMGKDADFCPADPTSSGSEVARDMKQTKDGVVDFLFELQNFKDDLLAELEDAMGVVAEGTKDITDEAGDINVNDWQSLIVILPYTMLPSLMIVAATLAMFDVSSCFFSCLINWLVLPLFILVTMGAFAVAGGMSIMAGINSDFCLPGGRPGSSPDESILSIMRVLGYEENFLPYQVANFYIRQCTLNVTDPWLDIRKYEPTLVNSLNSLRDMITKLTNEEISDELAVYCNRDFDILVPILKSMSDLINILRNSLIALLDLARCGRLIPLYTDTMYNAGCLYAPRAVFWVFYSCLILAFFGMLMITLRSSMKLSVEDPNYVGHFLQTESLSLRHQERDGDDHTEGKEADAHSTARHSDVSSPQKPPRFYG